MDTIVNNPRRKEDSSTLPPNGEVLEDIIKLMVERPSLVKVIEETVENINRLTIYCHRGDVGKIIGKNRSGIAALRDLFNRISAMDDMPIHIFIAGQQV